MPTIIFGNTEAPIEPSLAIVHDNESFNVQWSAANVGDTTTAEFTDRLVITSIPEGCPGTDDAEHPVVFDEEFDESPLAPGEVGALQDPTVGPFAVGAYRLTVTLADGSGATSFNCIDIVAAV